MIAIIIDRKIVFNSTKGIPAVKIARNAPSSSNDLRTCHEIAYADDVA